MTAVEGRGDAEVAAVAAVRAEEMVARGLARGLATEIGEAVAIGGPGRIRVERAGQAAHGA